MFNKIVPVVSLLAAAVHAADHVVAVGLDASITFNPNSIQAAPKDTVTFEFMSGNHTISQSSFNSPCTLESNGFNQAFDQVVAANATKFPNVTITVNDSSPIWVFCSQTLPFNHCQSGMVMAINANATLTFDQFRSNAINSANTNGNSGNTNGSPAPSTNSTSSGNGTAPSSASNSSSTGGSNSSSTGGSPKSGAMQVQLTGVMGFLAAVGSTMLFL